MRGLTEAEKLLAKWKAECKVVWLPYCPLIVA